MYYYIYVCIYIYICIRVCICSYAGFFLPVGFLSGVHETRCSKAKPNHWRTNRPESLPTRRRASWILVIWRCQKKITKMEICLKTPFSAPGE